MSSPCSSRMVKPLAFNCDEIKVSFSCKKKTPKQNVVNMCKLTKDTDTDCTEKSIDK